MLLLKGNDTLDGSDTREGLSAVISLKIPEALLQFEGQTKGKLGTPQAKTVVENIVYDKLSFFFEENKDASRAILLFKALSIIALVASLFSSKKKDNLS